jgi:hypothetical protein
MKKLASAVVLVALGLAASERGLRSQELPPIKVDLPPQPSWAAANIPDKYPDGKWSVHGLRKKLKANLNQEVEVKAILLDVYQCPPDQVKCPKGKTCKPCDQPHFFVADTKDTKKDRALVVCNYPVKPKPPTLPPVGTEVVVAGTFTREAGGFAASDGLVDHRKTSTADGKVISDGNALGDTPKGTDPNKVPRKGR